IDDRAPPAGRNPDARGLTGLWIGPYNRGETRGGSGALRPSPESQSGLTVTLFRPTPLILNERIRFSGFARRSFVFRPGPSSPEDAPMPENRRGRLCAGAVARGLLVAGAPTARAQDAVVRGTIPSDRGEPIPGANVLIDELRLGVVTNATGQYTLN